MLNTYTRKVPPFSTSCSHAIPPSRILHCYSPLPPSRYLVIYKALTPEFEFLLFWFPGMAEDIDRLPLLDRLPPKVRAKIILKKYGLNERLPEFNSRDGKTWNSHSSVVAVKEEGAGPRDSQSQHSDSFVLEEKIASWSSEQRYSGKTSHAIRGGQMDCTHQIIEANQMTTAAVTVEEVSATDTNSLQQSLLSKHAVSVKVPCADNNSISSSAKCRNASSFGGLEAIKINSESPGDFSDDLDCISLKERLRILLSRQTLGSTNSHQQCDSMLLSSSVVDKITQQSSKYVKEENHYDKEFPLAGNQFDEIQKAGNSDSSESVVALAIQGDQSSPLGHGCQGNKSAKPGNTTTPEKNQACFSNKGSFSGHQANGGQKNLLSGNTPMLNAAMKIEPIDKNEINPDEVPVDSLPSDDLVPVKSKLPDDSDLDELDNMWLRDRMKMLPVAKVPLLASRSDGYPLALESAKVLRSTRARKRRRTATDSVETALEEDAPGLLRVLIEKGVSVDEIKLYGEMESDEALNYSSTEDNFTEFEAVVSKIFAKRNSLLKLAPVRCSKVEKASYCLACLFSLVEQARYLQFRKWPVEWGWCRDLQSFIFVFERHNRIVLERPEYGYATYFFELVDALPINWQIKRLVTAMKLTSYSRITLIENKALVVGEDLSEGEAKVLKEYGWIPDTGLGTLLNYCDRVVHDRQNEKDTSEWRSKIGKLLVDGYNGGTIITADIPSKVVECSFSQKPDIKLELD